MYAISVHQPWAWAILHAGKNVENRSWRTNHRGPLLIHAAKSRRSYDQQDLARWEKHYGVWLPPWVELTKGAIVGVVEIVDCVRSERTMPERVELPGLGPCKWADPDCWCWVLEKPRAFMKPVVYRGTQLLFHVPDDVLQSNIKRS